MRPPLSQGHSCPLPSALPLFLCASLLLAVFGRVNTEKLRSMVKKGSGPLLFTRCGPMCQWQWGGGYGESISYFVSVIEDAEKMLQSILLGQKKKNGNSRTLNPAAQDPRCLPRHHDPHTSGAHLQATGYSPLPCAGSWPWNPCSGRIYLCKVEKKSMLVSVQQYPFIP